MAHVLIRHEVSSYEDWKEAFDNFAETRKASGELSFQVLQHEENSRDSISQRGYQGLAPEVAATPAGSRTDPPYNASHPEPVPGRACRRGEILVGQDPCDPATSDSD